MPNIKSPKRKVFLSSFPVTFISFYPTAAVAAVLTYRSRDPSFLLVQLLPLKTRLTDKLGVAGRHAVPVGRKLILVSFLWES